MDVSQLALTWAGWPNGERLESTCKVDLDQSERKSSQVNPSESKRSHKSQGFNLRLLASPFGQGFYFFLPLVRREPYTEFPLLDLLSRVKAKPAEEKSESLVRVDRLAGWKLLVITDRQ